MEAGHRRRRARACAGLGLVAAAALTLAAACGAPDEPVEGDDPAGTDAAPGAESPADDALLRKGTARRGVEPAPVADAARAAAPDVPDLFAEAPTRGRIGRIRSAVIESEVVFVGLETQPHALTLTCAFPARTRMELAGPGGSTLRYQLGERAWSLDRRGPAPTSRELVGSDRQAVALDLALRRALFFWPDEGEFVGGGRTLSSKVGDFGVLVATLEERGTRPVEMRAFASDGSVVGRIAVDAWFEEGGRVWPRRLRLLAARRPASDGERTATDAADEVLWHETVGSIDAGWYVGDPSFVPPDVLVEATGSAIAGARAIELPRRFEARVAVPRGTGLAAALERAIALRDRARTEGATGLADFVEVVVDRTGTPAAVVVTATDAREGPGWQIAAPSSGWRIEAPDQPGMDYEAKVGRVRAAATAGGGGAVEVRHRAGLDDTDAALPAIREHWIVAVPR